MGYKCVPQVMGLVRGEPVITARHRANGKKILQELGGERFSRSDTLDRSRSNLNWYSEYTSGGACWADMKHDADDYRQAITFKTGKRAGETVYRSLREDAVIGWSVIFNPPHEMTRGWTAEQFEQFYQDSFSVLGEIQPKLFRSENVRMRAKHRDEGVSREDEHEHRVGDAIDENGRYCGNLIDSKLLRTICEQYPAKMRERNWEIEDCDLTDFARLGMDGDGNYIDPEYRAETIPKLGKRGRSVNRYIADKAVALEEARQEGERIIAEANREAAERLSEGQEEAKSLREDNARLMRKNAALRASNRFYEQAESYRTYQERIKARLDAPEPVKAPYDQIAPKRRVRGNQEAQRQAERVAHVQEAFNIDYSSHEREDRQL